MQTKYVNAFLVNHARGDPALFIDLLGRSRAIMFDLGEVFRLERGELTRVSDLFISHTHMDHFFGFGTLLRANWGQDRVITLWGPPGLARNVFGALSAYTWNLASQTTLAFRVREAHPDHLSTTLFSSADAFAPGPTERLPHTGSVLLAEPEFTVTFARLDHKILCLAFCFTHADHLNVDKQRLAEAGLPEGPWIRDLKTMLAAGDPAEGATLRVAGVEMPAADLARRLVVRARGEKIAYVTDTIFSDATLAAVRDMAQESDALFCECAYAHADADRAAANHHLTAWQAGTMAAAARARDLRLFHFSPLYVGRESELTGEALSAFRRGGRGPKARNEPRPPTRRAPEPPASRAAESG
ncbi:MAG: MBL fold metallo-hydrolase [Planctomycetes bacterium]|nr:MBL fold metallo-hydrolase [Planctomycetota bacterium]